MQEILLNYIILVHQNPTQLERLVKRLNEKNVFFYIHVDNKNEIEPFKNAVSGFSNVSFIEKGRVNVIWGNISMVKATLLALKFICDKNNSKAYCILLSGADYPIKSREYIRQYFIDNYGDNFINSYRIENTVGSEKYSRLNKYNFHLFPDKRQGTSIWPVKLSNLLAKQQLVMIKQLFLKSGTKYLSTIFKRRKHPDYITPYTGSQWWALPIETIDFILDFLEKRTDFLKYHEFTHVPDEIFFQSIISSFIDHSKIKKSITYVNWSRKNCDLPVTFQVTDFEELKETDCLFARKFTLEKSKELLDKIDEKLL